MPTDMFTDSIAEDLHMQTSNLRPRRQNSVQSVQVEESDSKTPLSPQTNSEKECKCLFRRSKSRNDDWLIPCRYKVLGVTGVCVLVIWLIALTVVVVHLNNATDQSKSDKEENVDIKIVSNIVSGSGPNHGVLNMELDVLSLFDNTSSILKYKEEQPKTSYNSSGVKYNKDDGSFMIRKSGLFLIYSKVLVINYDGEKTAAFRQCLSIGNGNSECDLIKTLPKTRFPSHVLFVGHLQKDTVLNVQVNRKDLIFRDAQYSKLKIIEYKFK